MCTCLFLHDAQELLPQLLLLLVFNRDEYFARPTQAPHFWPDHPSILAGRDAVGHGTWLGITKCGRFAFVTNFREVKQPAAPADPPSRGDITTNFLLGTQTPLEYLQVLHGQDFHGFNAVVGDLQLGQVAYYSNRAGEPPRALKPGLYGVSNGLLMQWPKVQQGLTKLEQIVQRHQEPPQQGANHQLPWEQLFGELMSDTQKPEPHEVPLTGVGEHIDDALSPIFVDKMEAPMANGGLYGTRSQTVLAVWRDGHVEWRERYRDMEADAAWVQASHVFELGRPAPTSRMAATDTRRQNDEL